jgi:hypothetical protein
MLPVITSIQPWFGLRLTTSIAIVLQTRYARA